MAKAVFRPNELITVQEKVVIDSPTSYSDLAHYAPVEEIEEDVSSIEVYTGPTADDLRREAEMFRVQWEEERERMFSTAKEEAENILKDAQITAFAEVKKQADEGQTIKQQAEEEAKRIITEAQLKAEELAANIRQTLEAEQADAREKGRIEGREEGYAFGKAEVDRLIERTQVVLERAQDKRGEILGETEKEIVNLVLLIARKVIKVISENQRDVIVYNVIEALRKVKTRGTVIIRVNLADLKIATEYKQDFIRAMERAQSVQLIEDSTVDSGGCIIETEFGEIDARIASQLTELESKILEISPIRSSEKENLPAPFIRTANLNADLVATSSLMGASVSAPEPKKVSDLRTREEDVEEDDEELSSGVNAALTASAALAALATMATKGKRESDKKVQEKLKEIGRKDVNRRNTD